jgi:hypothetical protein
LCSEPGTTVQVSTPGGAFGQKRAARSARTPRRAVSLSRREAALSRRSRSVGGSATASRAARAPRDAASAGWRSRAGRECPRRRRARSRPAWEGRAGSRAATPRTDRRGRRPRRSRHRESGSTATRGREPGGELPVAVALFPVWMPGAVTPRRKLRHCARSPRRHHSHAGRPPGTHESQGFSTTQQTAQAGTRHGPVGRRQRGSRDLAQLHRGERRTKARGVTAERIFVAATWLKARTKRPG